MEQILEIKKNDLLLLNYPFSNGTSNKVRPVIVVSNNNYNKRGQDIVVVPLTSNLNKRDFSFVLLQEDLAKGNLLKKSLVKIDRIFSVKKSLVRMKIGIVKEKIHDIIIEDLFKLFN